MLFVAGGCGWFLLEWNNPGVGAPLVFTVGLVLYASAPPLLAHALLTYPGAALRVARRASDRHRLRADRCSPSACCPRSSTTRARKAAAECPRNLLLVHGSPALYRQLNRVGVYVGLVWTVLTLALLCAGAWRARASRRGAG